MKQEKKQVPTYRNKYISTTEFERRTAGFVKGNLRGNGLHSSIIQELSRDKYLKKKASLSSFRSKVMSWISSDFWHVYRVGTEEKKLIQSDYCAYFGLCMEWTLVLNGGA